MALSDKSAVLREQNTLWYVALIVILVAALVIWIIFSLRIDVFTEVLNRDESLSTLIVIDDGEKPLLTEILLLNPQTLNAGLVTVPKTTGMLLSSIDKVDRLEILYDPADPHAYATAIGELFNHPVNFTIHFHIDQFERFVDYIGGLDIFIPKAVDDIVDSEPYLFPPGGVKLDGAKARCYVEYRPDGEHIDERSDREHRIIQSLLGGIGENSEYLSHESVFSSLSDNIQSDFDQRALKSFFSTISKVKTERMILQGVLGNRRNLDGKEVLFPYYNGNLVRETVQRVLDALSQDDNFGEDLLTIRVEIQNGTHVNGLASRTAQVFESYGFQVVLITNAERGDHERTVVLDRRGSPEASRRVAELIHCEQIHSRIDADRDETVDVTVILGKDFDGRYVKKQL